jgi:hypothetical protein
MPTKNDPNGGISHLKASTIKPETFRLPRPGQRDPYFGLSRSAYYELERAGTIRLVRLCKRGNIRGTTLIPFDQVLAYVRRASDTGQ